jgi:ATP-dependent DNA helicase RecG
VLLYQPPLSDEGRARLKALTETDDGFVIAERDLELRGPGDFFGTRQWGLPRLRVGDLVRDAATMQLARDEARAWAETAPPHDGAVELVRRTWHDRFGYVRIG